MNSDEKRFFEEITEIANSLKSLHDQYGNVGCTYTVNLIFNGRDTELNVRLSYHGNPLKIIHPTCVDFVTDINNETNYFGMTIRNLHVYSESQDDKIPQHERRRNFLRELALCCM